ncbi:MAG: LysE family translocator [Halarcobacter ebronensis]|uniref:LysE family translocator n=1 Tax=Halarcobacter ebronensis TaxID=1462615 RepID=UPI003C791BD9
MDFTLYINEFMILMTALLIALLAPGPDFAMVFKQSITYGRRASIFTSIGIGLGSSIHIIYCILGIGLIISKSIILFNIIKYLGAAYLIYLGISSLRSKGFKIDKNNTIDDKNISDFKSFMVGFLCNALNPKATLFFLSMFTVVISIDTPLFVQAIYGLFCVLLATLYFVITSLFLTKDSVRRFFNKFGAWFDKAVGAVLISLGIKIALSK